MPGYAHKDAWGDAGRIYFSHDGRYVFLQQLKNSGGLMHHAL